MSARPCRRPLAIRTKGKRRSTPCLEPLENRTLLSSLSYSFTALNVSGTTFTDALGINNTGQIVGYYGDNDQDFSGFLLSGGNYTTLQVPGASLSQASGINDAGQIVGDYQAGGTTQGFLLSGGNYTTLDVPGADTTQAFGINDVGQIVGFEDPRRVGFGFLLSGGNYTTLDVPGTSGLPGTIASGINDAGQIVGSYSSSNINGTAIHGFLLSGGNYTTLDVPGATYTSANGINDVGQIVGDYQAGSATQGFLLSGGSFTTFDVPGATYTSANGINDAGQIVGDYSDASGEHGFLATPFQPQLSSVSFGNKTDGFYLMSSDPNPTSGSITNYAAPQWGGPNNNQYPVLYAGGSTPTVAATFQLSSSQPLPTVEAQGIGPDGFDVPATNLTQSGNQLSLSNAQMSKRFASTVQYYKDFSIDWQLSDDGGKDWVDVGTSDNPMYVSAAAPTPDPASGDLFLTVVNSAVMNTQGLSSSANAQIISRTWGIFTGLNVTDYAGNALSYYANINSQNTTVASLLQYHDGQCGAWTGLFLDMLLVNGINPAGDYVIVTAGTPGESGFLVDNWNFPTSGASHNPIYPYVNYNASGQYPLFNNNQYVWTYADVTDAPGIPGQNSANPASLFGNHQIAEINGIYYDSSYGVTYNSLLQMDSQSIAGFFTFGEYYAAPLHKFVKAMFTRQNTDPKSGDLVGFNQNWSSQSDATLGIPTIHRPVALEASLATNLIPLGSISRDGGVISLSAISNWGSSNVHIRSTTTAKRAVTPVRQPFLGMLPSRTMGSIRPAQKTKTFLYGEA
jgi:uncharacterized membrane protein